MFSDVIEKTERYGKLQQKKLLREEKYYKNVLAGSYRLKVSNTWKTKNFKMNLISSTFFLSYIKKNNNWNIQNLKGN